MKRKFAVSILMVVVMVACLSCATLQEKYDKATPQEKSQIWISQFQMTVKQALALGSAYVDKNPQYRQQWKDKGIATAKVVNGLLDDFIADLEAGKAVSVTTIIVAVASKIGELVALVESWGIKLSNYDPLGIMIKLEGGEA